MKEDRKGNKIYYRSKEKERQPIHNKGETIAPLKLKFDNFNMSLEHESPLFKSYNN